MWLKTFWTKTDDAAIYMKTIFFDKGEWNPSPPTASFPADEDGHRHKSTCDQIRKDDLGVRGWVTDEDDQLKSKEKHTRVH